MVRKLSVHGHKGHEGGILFQHQNVQIFLKIFHLKEKDQHLL